jgi:hypothetical protein
MEKAWSHSDGQDNEQFLKNKAREDKPRNKMVIRLLPDACSKNVQPNKLPGSGQRLPHLLIT